MPSAPRRTQTQPFDSPPAAAAKQAGRTQKKGKGLDAEIITSSAVSAFLKMLPTSTSCVDKDLDSYVPSMDAYQSSSGNSSPHHDEEVVAVPGAAPAASDINFHVDDIEMWEVLEALDGAPLPTEQRIGCTCCAPVTLASCDRFARPSAVPAPASQPPVDESLLKQPTAPFSPPHATATQNRMAGVSPVKSTAQPAKAASPSGSKAVKRPLLEAVCPTPAAAPAAPASLDDESDLGLEPLESCPHDLPDGSADVSAVELTEGEGQMDPLEEKRLKRMRRNRESAAMSRNRKKAYIEELEAKVAALSNSVQQLQSENWTLKQECALIKTTGSEGEAGAAPMPEALHSGSSSGAEDDLGLSLEPLVPAAGGDLGVGGLSTPPAAQDGAGGAEAASGAKKVSAASLAVMSALTFVTLSANSGGSLWAREAGHSPGSRALMSLSDLSLSDEPVPRFGDEAAPLWPAIEQAQPPALYSTPEPVVTALAVADALPTPEPVVTALPPPVRPPPSTEHARVKVAAPEEFEVADQESRVLMLPRNSSWADALRVEAAEKHLTVLQQKRVTAMPDETQLLASPLPQYPLDHAAAAEKVYEPSWKADDEDYDAFDEVLGLSAEAEAARRFIFCARAYTFDVASSRRARAPGGHTAPAPAPSAPAPSRELSLPAMPARFLHGASRSLPQLTDGHTGGNESEPLPLPAARYPVVKMLLPSAALRGVISGVDDEVEAGVGASADAGAHALGGELMQVSCQVLNASRWGGA